MTGLINSSLLNATLARLGRSDSFECRRHREKFRRRPARYQYWYSTSTGPSTGPGTVPRTTLLHKSTRARELAAVPPASWWHGSCRRLPPQSGGASRPSRTQTVCVRDGHLTDAAAMSSTAAAKTRAMARRPRHRRSQHDLKRTRDSDPSNAAPAAQPSAPRSRLPVRTRRTSARARRDTGMHMHCAFSAGTLLKQAQTKGIRSAALQTPPARALTDPDCVAHVIHSRSRMPGSRGCKCGAARKISDALRNAATPPTTAGRRPRGPSHACYTLA